MTNAWQDGLTCVTRPSVFVTQSHFVVPCVTRLTACDAHAPLTAVEPDVSTP